MHAHMVFGTAMFSEVTSFWSVLIRGIPQLEACPEHPSLGISGKSSDECALWGELTTAYILIYSSCMYIVRFCYICFQLLELTMCSTQNVYSDHILGYRSSKQGVAYIFSGNGWPENRNIILQRSQIIYTTCQGSFCLLIMSPIAVRNCCVKQHYGLTGQLAV